MKYLFFVLAAIFYAMGVTGCIRAQTASQEIGSSLMLVIGTLYFVGAGIVEAIHARHRQDAMHRLSSTPPTPAPNPTRTNWN